jgi:hypothetical protein
VARTKLLAFAISSGIAGVGGVLLGFKQVEVSSANFAYGFSLSVLAFAYLAGITSINGGIVAGVMLSAGAIVTTGSNYFFAGTNIDNYVAPLSGLSIIVTAIVHPEGIAPFFGEGARSLGNWFVSAVPGMETIRREYRGPRQVLVKAVLAAMVIGWALAVYNLQISELVEVQVLAWLAILLIAAILFARLLGPLSPTFTEAGGAWMVAAKNVGPAAVVGYIAGWIIWPLRVDTYEKFWMPLVGAALGVFIWGIVLQIRAARAHTGGRDPDDLTPFPDRVLDDSTPMPVEAG